MLYFFYIFFTNDLTQKSDRSKQIVIKYLLIMQREKEDKTNDEQMQRLNYLFLSCYVLHATSMVIILAAFASNFALVFTFASLPLPRNLSFGFQ